MSEGEERDLLEGFSMAPAWARKSAVEYASKQKKYDGEYEERPDRVRRDRRNRDPELPGKRDRPFDEPRMHGRGRPLKTEVPMNGGGSADFAHYPRRENRARLEPLPFNIRFLPEQKALNVIARKVQSSCHALPLRNVVRLFFENPDNTEVRLEMNEQNREKRFYQCSKCGWFSLSSEDLDRHIVSAHMSDVFDTVEVDDEKPSGNFASVAICGLTGKLLGPPNHHGFNIAVRRAISTYASGMSEQDFRSHVKISHEADDVERWKTEFAHSTKYVRKESDDKTQMTFEQAEDIFKAEFLPGMRVVQSHITVSREASKRIDDKRIFSAIAAAWEREQEMHTGTLFISVRGGLRSRKIFLFRASDERRTDFVVRRAPVFLDTSHAIPELKSIMEYVGAHPGCTRSELLSALITEGTPDDVAERIRNQLAWTTERGHLVEYYNEVIALPEAHPFFRSVTNRTRHGGSQDSSAKAVTHCENGLESTAQGGEGKPAADALPADSDPNADTEPEIRPTEAEIVREVSEEFPGKTDVSDGDIGVRDEELPPVAGSPAD